MSEPKVLAQHDQVTNEICLSMNETGESKKKQNTTARKRKLMLFDFLIYNQELGLTMECPNLKVSQNDSTWQKPRMLTS